eukprot:CAMPEP_0119058988 /NCGR_PEP_ID=MMETSP1178-20130426/3215_1 /TAXON_ID=33656 /ORGANISM="unid sp, Strain CCMP2000" /LENGTH=99 /DNA_ID=CAMNT_0007039983 /DNA_START=93 /DNA_END=392 /DNA_ORIENTATION=-
MKDMEYTEKEILSQQARIQKVKDDPEKDEHDVKKQEEVLSEYLGARTDEFERLKEFTNVLKTFMEGIAEELAELKESEEVKAAQKALAGAMAVIDAKSG